MPKVSIIRKGARRSVAVPAQLAHKLTQTKNWSYTDASVSQPKRTVKKQHEAGGNEAKPVAKAAVEPVKEEANPQAKSEAVTALSSLPKGLTMSAGKPMTSARFAAKPTRPVAMTREELEGLTKADLKVLGQKMGVDLKPSEPKDEWVTKLTRYMRRDMRAAR